MTLLRNFRFTIGRKIYAIIALSLFGFLGLTWFATSQLESSLIQQRRQELKHVIELAVDVVREEYDRAQKAGTPLEQARERAAARVGALRYGDGEYIFITDAKYIVVMHAAASQIGKDMSGAKDPTGKRFIAEMNDLVRRDGSAFVEYVWPKPGFDQPQQKLSYAASFAPFGWTIGTGVYMDDLQRQIWEATRGALVVAAVMIAVIGAFSGTVAWRTAGAMRGMTAAMRELAGGKLDVVLPGLGRKDEIGEIAGAVENFKLKAVEKAEREAKEREARDHTAAEDRRRLEEREAAQKKSAEDKAAADRKAAMLKLASEFEAAVGGIVGAVSSSATELEAAAGTLTHTAATTQSLATTVAAASEQASANVQSVASATEELGSSVHEIGRQVHESSRIAGQAVKQAEQTDARIGELSQAASRIGDVVKLISAVAEQTNLLALCQSASKKDPGSACKRDPLWHGGSKPRASAPPYSAVASERLAGVRLGF